MVRPVAIPSSGSRLSGPTDSTIAAADAELLAAIESLRGETRGLIDRVESLEMNADLAPVGMASAPRSVAGASRSDIESIVKDVLGSIDTADGTTVAATPAMQAAVESVLDMREERERLEREQKRAEAQVQRMEDRLAKLQTDLGLDQNQVNSMRTILQDEEVRRDDMRTKMREARDGGNMDMGDVRQMWTDMRTETNTAVQGVLSPSQYEQYQESQQNDRWGGRQRGGTDAGGGGGRRGR